MCSSDLKREGNETPVEVGLVVGLGMKMDVPNPDKTTRLVAGSVQYEAVEVLQLKLGSGADTLVVGGALITDPTESADPALPRPVGWTPESNTDNEIPSSRLRDGGSSGPASSPGVFANRWTTTGMTLVDGGGGADDIRILRTQDQPAQKDQASDRVTLARTGGPQQERRLDIRADVGFFVLEFAGDTVPGAEQTLVLPYTVSAAQLQEALAALRLVGDPGGGKGLVEVQELTGPAAGVRRSFRIRFSNLLGALPDLTAYDTKLLVDGGAGDDTISLQAIQQPTYMRGGTGRDRFQVNVAKIGRAHV